MPPTATTCTGVLEGREKRGALLFAGVPYAAPPVGPLRFRPPQAVLPWTGTRKATTFGPQSWQGAQVMAGLFAQENPNNSEDCLTLNLMTPAVDAGRRPVMFWIHGGGFQGGTGATPWYDGHAFVTRHDVVVVTINYRLGALGFLHLADLAGDEYRSSGLNGILDQIAALEWVRDNVAAFGGDPNNVTVFGESAGGFSVGTLLGMPSARGLFHKAIAQSGAAHFVLTPAVAARRTEVFCKAGGFSSLGDLLEAEPERLVAAQVSLAAELLADHIQTGTQAVTERLGLPFQPVLDGVALPEMPLDAVWAGAAANVALLIGTNLDEWNLFGLSLSGELDRDRAIRRLDRALPGSGKVIFDTFAAARPGASAVDINNAIYTDVVFRIPAIRLAEAHAQAAHPSTPTRMYLFTHASTAFDGTLGSCHALEIPFVFDSVGRAGVEMFLGHAAPPGLAESMNAAWAAFAHDGDPSHETLPEWPVYEPDTRATMEFGDERAILTDPMGAEREVWGDLL